MDEEWWKHHQSTTKSILTDRVSAVKAVNKTEALANCMEDLWEFSHIGVYILGT